MVTHIGGKKGKFRSEFQCLEHLDDLGEVSCDSLLRKLFIPHDHLDTDSLSAVDYLVELAHYTALDGRTNKEMGNV